MDDDQLEAQLRAAIDAGDKELIDEISALVDLRERAVASVPLVAAALWYAEQGLPVFPLQPGTKIPLRGSRGCKDASVDPSAIRAWWEATPDANIGIATGHLVDVVDVDGAEGQKSRVANWDMFEGLEIIAQTLTPRPGGMHFFVPASGKGNKAGLLPSVDYRGKGGYACAPPSVLDERPGQVAGTYRFLGTPHFELLAAAS